MPAKKEIIWPINLFWYTDTFINDSSSKNIAYNNTMTSFKKAIYRWKEIIAITIAIRLSLLVYSLVFINNGQDIFTPWAGWDGNWYLDIAQNGYTAFGEKSIAIVFYPFYPILIKLASFFIPNLPLAAILVSTLFSVIAAIALFELVILDFNKRAAIFSVWFLNIFPTSYLFQAGYTESVFLTTSILTVYLFRKNKFLFSGLLGLLASLTKIFGLTLLPLLFVEKRITRQHLITYLMVPAGFLIYLGINLYIFGDPLYFTKPLFENWGKRLDWPWMGIYYLLGSDLSINSVYFPELFALLLIIFMGIYTFLKIRRSYGVYILINLLLITSTNYILSTPRYALILFPIFIALGSIKSIKVIIFISIIFIILLLHFTYFYISGRWAF